MSLKLTKQGVEKYKLEIEEKKNQLKELGIFKGQIAVECGDVWHDNHTFEQTEIQERALINTINTMIENLNNAEIIEEDENMDCCVKVGSTVKGKMYLLGTDEEPEDIEIKIVGDANPSSFTEVTLNSPLGSVIFQKKIGDKVEYEVNGNKFQFEILNIE